MKVGLQGFFSCNYFTEDLSCYAPEPADDIFIDELRSTDAEENKNLGSASENWDSNEDVRRNTSFCEENRDEHILREKLRKLAEFEMVQGIKIADHEVRRPWGGATKDLGLIGW